MSQPVRIPADVDREDTVVANLTARQLLILAVTGTVLYGVWSLSRGFVPAAVFLLGAVPVAGAAAFLALGRRDGLSMDRLVLAAVRQRAAARLQIAAPEGTDQAPAWLAARVTSGTEHLGKAAGPPSLPVSGVDEAGVIDLGSDGLAAVAACGTVNFALRTPTEQEALVAAFGRYLHSLTAPVQVLVRAERLDLSAQIAELHAQAAGLPHPALENAAREHADYLVELGRSSVLLRRQVLLVLREPLGAAPPTDGLGGASPLAALAQLRAGRRSGPVTEAALRAAENRLARRLSEAAELLGPTGITVTPLDAGQASAVLAAACNPDSLLPPSAELVGPQDVITGAWPDGEEDRS
ncbi:PrgI family protein [Streptomyces sp. NPDC021224]|uniref:PrgI family protein n=1 Tax=unclassified Streptomyces TaxID=2593676 RepID=UPI00379C2261